MYKYPRTSHEEASEERVTDEVRDLASGTSLLGGSVPGQTDALEQCEMVRTDDPMMHDKNRAFLLCTDRHITLTWWAITHRRTICC